MGFLLVPLTLFIVIMYPVFHRWAFYPKRDPDFEHRLYVYWFDEKIAYGKLANKKRVKFYEHKGYLYEDEGGNNKLIDLFDDKARRLPLEVQQAYQQHIHVKFEEAFLEDN